MAKKNEIIVKDVVIMTIIKTALTISALQILAVFLHWRRKRKGCSCFFGNGSNT